MDEKSIFEAKKYKNNLKIARVAYKLEIPALHIIIFVT